jgi:ribokinase
VTSVGPLAIVGAINVDLVVTGVALPKPGQTSVGGTFAQHQGGKGGNQAVAAARAGAPVALLGAVGADDPGAAARVALDAEGIDLSRLRLLDDHATGVALIAVNHRGENQIVVAPGANGTLSDLAGDLDAVGPSLVLLSCEIPYKGCLSVARWCEAADVPLIVNPAPANLRLRHLMDHAMATTPNRGELLNLVVAETDPRGAAAALRARNPHLAIVITLGEDGAMVVDDDGETLIDVEPVAAIDTTGAGDCFNGVLAASMHAGLELAAAARRAAAAAALSVTVAGAREGMPSRAAIDAAVAG